MPAFNVRILDYLVPVGKLPVSRNGRCRYGAQSVISNLGLRRSGNFEARRQRFVFGHEAERDAGRHVGLEVALLDLQAEIGLEMPLGPAMISSK
jgi:hypothetical protein